MLVSSISSRSAACLEGLVHLDVSARQSPQALARHFAAPDEQHLTAHDDAGVGCREEAGIGSLRELRQILLLHELVFGLQVAELEAVHPLPEEQVGPVRDQHIVAEVLHGVGGAVALVERMLRTRVADMSEMPGCEPASTLRHCGKSSR
jgi:hypothetical protein